MWDGSSKKRTIRTIYLATDDPDTVKKEIQKLPKGQGGTTIVGGELQLYNVQTADMTICLTYLNSYNPC